MVSLGRFLLLLLHVLVLPKGGSTQQAAGPGPAAGPVSGPVPGAEVVVVPMKATGMSVHDHPSMRKFWWRQLIPSFFEDHMHTLNITVREEWHDRTECQPRYFGLINHDSRSHEAFLLGGTGIIKHMYQQQVAEIKCYYKTNHGTYVFPERKDSEGFIGVSVYCPIWQYDVKNVAFCEYLSTKNVTSELTLFSNNVSEAQRFILVKDESSTRNISTFANSELEKNVEIPVTVDVTSLFTSARDLVVVSLSSSQGVLSECTPTPPTSSVTPSSILVSDLVVCTVQTYASPTSGPMLWLFSRYYHLIGFRVVIYDRYGRHESFLRDLIDAGQVSYHPYTAFQLARPDLYNTDRATAEVSTAVHCFSIICCCLCYCPRCHDVIVIVIYYAGCWIQNVLRPGEPQVEWNWHRRLSCGIRKSCEFMLNLIFDVSDLCAYNADSRLYTCTSTIRRIIHYNKTGTRLIPLTVLGSSTAVNQEFSWLWTVTNFWFLKAENFP